MTRICSLALLLLFPAIAMATPPPFVAYKVVDTAPEAIAVTIKNVNSSAITGYVLELMDAKNQKVLEWRWSDSVVDMSRRAIFPGGSVSFQLAAGRKAREAEVRVAATIYADGSALGDPRYLQRMFEDRARFFEDADTALAVLQAAVQAPQPAIDSLLRLFKARSRVHAAEFKDHGSPGWPRIDRVCLLVISELSNLDGREPAMDPRKKIDTVLDILQNWKAETAGTTLAPSNGILAGAR